VFGARGRSGKAGERVGSRSREKPVVEGPVDLDLGLTEEKPENGLGPMDLGFDRGEGRGGLGEGRKSVLEPTQFGGCGPRRAWLAGDSLVQARNRRRK
jgi:hypothetical protein